MNLKKLHENALWQNLKDADFKVKTRAILQEQSEVIERFTQTIIKLEEEVQELKKQHNLQTQQILRLSKQTKINQRQEDDNQVKQKRNIRAVPQSY